jgi:hypothetical protein
MCYPQSGSIKGVPAGFSYLASDPISPERYFAGVIFLYSRKLLIK